MKRKLEICYNDNVFEVETEKDGTNLKCNAVQEELGLNDTEMKDIVLQDGVHATAESCHKRAGAFFVGSFELLFVKGHWGDSAQWNFVDLEAKLRLMMAQYKTQQPRKTAPSEWTRSIGYSSENNQKRKGFETPAPFTTGRGISKKGLRKSDDLAVFNYVGKILQQTYPKFAEVFEKAGRVDIKYNSTISKEDKHFDNKDVCHQVFFTMGTSEENLCVQEEENLVKIRGEAPQAFDGRFQHWVEVNNDSERDRLSVVCYLVDAPESFKHHRKKVADL